MTAPAPGPAAPKVLVLVRDERRPEADGIEGRMFVGGAYLGPTLERGAVAIPFGVWPIKVHDSPKFGRKTLLIACGRGFTLIHAGAVPAHSEGCVLLGDVDEAGARISGRRRVAWLEADVIDEIEAGTPWWAIVLEPGGDVEDGVLV